MSNKKECTISWRTFVSCVNKIENRIKTNYSHKKFKVLWGIPRGGLVLAAMLSHRLNVPLCSKDTIPKIRPLLLVDDIADTGKTLKGVLSLTENNDDIVIATIHYHKQSSIIPDIWIKEKKDKWIVYPWETK